MQKKKSPSILSIGTAVPQYTISQKKYSEFVHEALPLSETESKFVERICSRSEIEKRHFVLDDPLRPRKEWSFLSSKYPEKKPTMRDRNEKYKYEAPLLALEAARNALKKWGGDVNDITHVISISCTGVVAPGIEFYLTDKLDLSRNVSRLGINFMGCFGAFRGLQVAQALSFQNSENRILLVCTELCSLHFQDSKRLDVIVGNALFADGSAAVVVGTPKKNEPFLYEIVDSHSYADTDSLDEMTWEAGDFGFEMKLSSKVPTVVSEKIEVFAKNLLKKRASFEECQWAIHPGGKEIIRVIADQCNLSESQTQSSKNILSQFGNMSSATFLFVLDDLVKRKKEEEWIIGIGFGPGLSFEGVLLKKGEF